MSSTAMGEPETSTATVLILDFGAQYSQLIARRVRESNVYSEIVPHDTPWEELEARKPAAVILTGGPESTLAADAPGVDPRLYTSGIPLLGICYGLQLIARDLGGELVRSANREFGPTTLEIVREDPLFAGVPQQSRAWMSHGDTVLAPPSGFMVLARTQQCEIAAIGARQRRIYGVQFHTEVVHTEAGKRVIANFLHDVAEIPPSWRLGSFVDRSVAEIREEVGDGRVICALSGGVDSAVAATLVSRAVGDQLS
ncbi:MAG: glutamine-hydrolyzing GMP synthase, partial [Candidatus Eremiobacteraeota bacterium]|nr:glutamine-hydrolyzing GMP synthase [Candidatus Eremiobacteraeota bacterium]